MCYINYKKHLTRINQTQRAQSNNACLHPDRTGRAENKIGKVVVDAAIAVHKATILGLYETMYEVVVSGELKRYGLLVEREVPVLIEYDGIKFDEG